MCYSELVVELPTQNLPALPGAYLLWFEIEQPLVFLAGRLGTVELVPGRYIYVGSALGPGGVRSRLRRHVEGCREGRRLHWHIDYLTAVRLPETYRYALGAERLECSWVQQVRTAGASWAVRGFGSSDCRQGCLSHLLAVPDPWSIQTIEDLLL